MNYFVFNCNGRSAPSYGCNKPGDNSGEYVRKKDADKLRMALELITEAYTDLVNCGDCGHWNPEHDEEVVAARAALEETKPQ